MDVYSYMGTQTNKCISYTNLFIHNPHPSVITNINKKNNIQNKNPKKKQNVNDDE